MSNLEESAAFRKAIEAVVDARLKEKAKSCFRLYPAVVVTAPNSATGVCVVRMLGDTTELSLPYSSVAASVVSGDRVLIGVVYDNFRNAVVWCKGDFSGFGGGGGGQQADNPFDRSWILIGTQSGALVTTYTFNEEWVGTYQIRIEDINKSEQLSAIILVEHGASTGDKKSVQPIYSIDNSKWGYVSVSNVYSGNDEYIYDHTDVTVKIPGSSVNYEVYYRKLS